MFPSGRQDRNSLSPIVVCRACLHRETCRFFSAYRREIPRLSLRGESSRRHDSPCYVCYNANNNGVTALLDDIYIVIVVEERGEDLLYFF